MSKHPENTSVIIFDTTLRDGEQSPGASMNLEEKLSVASVLEELNVDVIEAGFPIASIGDFEAVHKIASMIKRPTICALARTRKDDIERAAEALAPAEKKRIHTFISTSPLHMKHKLRMNPEDVYQATIDNVTLARQLTDDVEWSAEDATRTDIDFLCHCIEGAISAGAKTINVPDTVGYTVPEEYGHLLSEIMNRVPNIDQAILSVHCHNDLGLAVANSLAALNAGARQIECTINGIGERAGNAALEEVVMAMQTRHNILPYTTNIITQKIMKASRTVSAVTGFTVQSNKAIVGKNAFAHESGIHQDGILKDARTYEIMTPETIGLTESKIVLGKHSGRHAFRDRLKQLGYELQDADLQDAFKRFKQLADLKKDIFDEDIIALIDDEILRINNHIQLLSMEISSGTGFDSAQASMTLLLEKEKKSIQATGNGPVDATFNCIKKISPIRCKLKLYQVHAITGGTDAQGEVTVRLENEAHQIANGQGSDTDVIVASAKAYLNALNKFIT